MRHKIHRYYKQTTWAMVALSFLKGLLIGLPILSFGLILLGGIDEWLSLPTWARQSVWVGFLTGSGGAFVFGFWPFHKFRLTQRSKTLFQNQDGRQPLRPDELKLAMELSTQPPQEGVSDDLRQEFLGDFEKKLSGFSVFDTHPSWKGRKTVFISTGILLSCSVLWAFFPAQFPMGSRVVFPFGNIDLSQFITVWPGNAEMPWGEDVNIRVTVQMSSLTKPELYVKAKKEWLPVESGQEEKGTQDFVFKNLVEPLQYRVRWKSDWGEKYQIIPKKPITLSDFTLTLKPPLYLGDQRQTQTSPEVTGLPGTVVQIEATASEKLEAAGLLFEDGAEKPVQIKNGDQIKVDFSLNKSGGYGFYLKSVSGRQTRQNNTYPLHVVADNAPTVTLLSPEEDLIIGENEELPLTYQAQDDFGLKKTFLVWKKGSGTPVRVQIRNYQRSQTNVLETHNWDLGQHGFQPGDVITYHIEVWDANVITGPGKERTEKRIIEIASFEKSHKALEKVLETWRDDVLDLLADVNTLKSKAEVEGSDLNKMTTEMNDTAGKSSRLEDVLEKIVRMMEEDPLADYGVWLEHEAMSENFETLNQTTMKKAQAAFQTKNKKEAVSQLDQLGSELERMLALSEELSKTQKARDVLDAGDRLSEIGEELTHQLQMANESPKMDPEQLKKIQNLVEEAMDMLQKMAETLEKFPDELPEDFVNQEALENLAMDESEDLLSQIQKAIQQGDAKKALNLAKQFHQMAQQMKEKLADAHESYLEENSAEELSNAIEEQVNKLNQIANQQRDVLAETQKLESKRMEAVAKEQLSLLRQLAARQAKYNTQIRTVEKKRITDHAIRAQIIAQLSPMRSILEEFRKERLEKAPAFLASVIKSLLDSEGKLKKGGESEEVQILVQGVREGEQDILKLLEKTTEPKDVFSNQDKKKFKELQQQQQQLEQQMGGLRSELQSLAQKSASLGTTLMQSLSGARVNMNQASKELGQGKSKPAQTSEESALRHILNATLQLQNASDAMGGMASQQKPGGQSGGGSSRAIRRGTRPGSKGTKTGKVRLPTADDYKPPKEFREELLESLRERYPELYEDIIHKYFKRLSE